ncbi:hypothetical protein EZS27_023829 [termite gut metagenome]|uniref:Uncharacterized protein n=1 Tax=termite gut metagenome TaxID=433724 RepID=A0A5J4R1D2_9ZZZZ
MHNKALLDLEREYISKTLDATEKNLPTINTTYSSYNETITSVSDLILDAKRASIDKDPIIAYIRSRQDIISAIKDLKNKIIALQEEANSYIKVEDTNVQDLDNYIDPNLAQ